MRKIIYEGTSNEFYGSIDFRHKVMEKLSADEVDTYYFGLTERFDLYHLCRTSILFESRTIDSPVKLTLIGSEKDIGEVEKRILDAVQESKSQKKDGK